MAPIYEYQAVNRSGKQIKGSIEGEHSSEVAKQLKENGYYITSISEKREGRSILSKIKLPSRVKTKDLTIFSQQFAAMIDAGISLVDCLDILQKETGHPRLKEVIRGMKGDIETGMSLSEAMFKYPDVFPTLYCQLIKAGETGGVLDKVLNQLVDHYERQDEINRKVKSALYYPVTILVVAVAVVIFLVVKIVPTFVEMFSGFGGELPGPTRLLLGMSSFIKNYWWLIMAFLGIVFLLFYNYRNTPQGKYRIDKVMLRIPVIGGMLGKVMVSRFASTLAILLASGVDLLASLSIVEEVLDNRVYGDVLVEARGQIREGINLSVTLDETPVFPNMVVQMIKIGEEAGSLELMLKKIDNFYNKEVESSIDASISLIEPVMIVFLAAIVGFIVISIVLPMFDMYQYF
jgi:type IV pilus assembly protein PilC